MKSYISLSFLILFYLLSGCAPSSTESNEYKLRFSMNTVGSPTIDNAGGIYVVATNQDSLVRRSVFIDSLNEEGTLDLINGNWVFSTVAFSGIAPLSGLVTCDQQKFSLNGEELIINLNLNLANCEKVLENSSSLEPLQFRACSDLDLSQSPTEGSCSFPLYKRGDVKSARVNIITKRSATTADGDTQNKLVNVQGACINADPTGVINTNSALLKFKPLVGSRLGLSVYKDRDCLGEERVLVKDINQAPRVLSSSGLPLRLVDTSFFQVKQNPLRGLFPDMLCDNGFGDRVLCVNVDSLNPSVGSDDIIVYGGLTKTIKIATSSAGIVGKNVLVFDENNNDISNTITVGSHTCGPSAGPNNFEGCQFSITHDLSKYNADLTRPYEIRVELLNNVPQVVETKNFNAYFIEESNFSHNLFKKLYHKLFGNYAGDRTEKLEEFHNTSSGDVGSDDSLFLGDIIQDEETFSNDKLGGLLAKNGYLTCEDLEAEASNTTINTKCGDEEIELKFMDLGTIDLRVYPFLRNFKISKPTLTPMNAGISLTYLKDSSSPGIMVFFNCAEKSGVIIDKKIDPERSYERVTLFENNDPIFNVESYTKEFEQYNDQNNNLIIHDERFYSSAELDKSSNTISLFAARSLNNGNRTNNIAANFNFDQTSLNRQMFYDFDSSNTISTFSGGETCLDLVNFNPATCSTPLRSSIPSAILGRNFSLGSLSPKIYADDCQTAGSSKSLLDCKIP